jgi:CheY-like chemotaxis protein
MSTVSRPILIVEDDPDIRQMLATLLEGQGHAVVTAVNGLEAFEMARTHHPALILLDLMMPMMTGQEFRDVQLASSDISAIPVIVVSAHYDAQRIARHMRAAACVQKPLDFDVVLHLCTHVLSTSEPGSGEQTG